MAQIYDILRKKIKTIFLPSPGEVEQKRELEKCHICMSDNS